MARNAKKLGARQKRRGNKKRGSLRPEPASTEVILAVQEAERPRYCYNGYTDCDFDDIYLSRKAPRTRMQSVAKRNKENFPSNNSIGKKLHLADSSGVHDAQFHEDTFQLSYNFEGPPLIVRKAPKRRISRTVDAESNANNRRAFFEVPRNIYASIPLWHDGQNEAAISTRKEGPPFTRESYGCISAAESFTEQLVASGRELEELVESHKKEESAMLMSLKEKCNALESLLTSCRAKRFLKMFTQYQKKTILNFSTNVLKEIRGKILKKCQEDRNAKRLEEMKVQSLTEENLHLKSTIASMEAERGKLLRVIGDLAKQYGRQPEDAQSITESKDQEEKNGHRAIGSRRLSSGQRDKEERDGREIDTVLYESVTERTYNFTATHLCKEDHEESKLMLVDEIVENVEEKKKETVAENSFLRVDENSNDIEAERYASKPSGLVQYADDHTSIFDDFGGK